MTNGAPPSQHSQPNQPPACPLCGPNFVMRYVPEHSRYYCDNCRQWDTEPAHPEQSQYAPQPAPNPYQQAQHSGPYPTQPVPSNKLSAIHWLGIAIFTVVVVLVLAFALVEEDDPEAASAWKIAKLKAEQKKVEAEVLAKKSVEAYEACTAHVKQKLPNPKTAKFPSVGTKQVYEAHIPSLKWFQFVALVNAKDARGYAVRYLFRCRLKEVGHGDYEPIFVKVHKTSQ